MGLGGEAVMSILVIVLDIHTVLLINGNVIYVVAAGFSPLLIGNVVDLLHAKVIAAYDTRMLDVEKIECVETIFDTKAVEIFVNHGEVTIAQWLI